MRCPEGHIATKALPDDMQMFVFQILEEYANRDRLPRYLPLREIATSEFPDVPLSMHPGDDRGVPHATAMIGATLPPVVVVANAFIDGRHRLYAARREGKASLVAIDLSKWVMESQVEGDCAYMGRLQEACVPRKNSGMFAL